jgi:hypothetical protein
MFNILEIVEACCKYIEKQLHPSNCLGIHKFAVQHDLHELIKTAWNYILVKISVFFFIIIEIFFVFFKTHFTNVIQNNHEFLELSFDEIKQILASGKSYNRLLSLKKKQAIQMS